MSALFVVIHLIGSFEQKLRLAGCWPEILDFRTVLYADHAEHIAADCDGREFVVGGSLSAWLARVARAAARKSVPRQCSSLVARGL